MGCGGSVGTRGVGSGEEVGNGEWGVGVFTPVSAGVIAKALGRATDLVAKLEKCLEL